MKGPGRKGRGHWRKEGAWGNKRPGREGGRKGHGKERAMKLVVITRHHNSTFLTLAMRIQLRGQTTEI